MLTVIHVVAGSVVLVVAPAALVARKGGAWHRRWGTTFMLAMAVVLGSAGFMWQARGHLFLLALALVSAYLVYNGYRLIARHRRRGRTDPLDDRVDALAALAAIVCGGWLFAIARLGTTALLHELAPILIGLGALAIAFALNDLRGIRGPRSHYGWLIAHLCAMLAAYISAVTAFIVINAHGVPMTYRWLLPIGLGTIVICAYVLPYRLPKHFLASFNGILARAKR